VEDNPMKMRARFLTMALAGALAPATWAQSPSSMPAEKGGPPAADQKFMTDAAADGMAEVELGRLASDKATRQEVKDFGKMMADDHSKANDELKTLAAEKKVTLPADLKPQHKAEKDRLEKMSGAAFDDAYLKAMVRDHQKAVDLFTKEASSGRDPETKAWAERTLPKLKEHLAHVKKLASGSDAAAKR
jgi:putative membrane protein